jgi:hypothetical protein
MSEGFDKPARSPELFKLARIKGIWLSGQPFLPGSRIDGSISGETKEEYMEACEGFCYLVNIVSRTPEWVLNAHSMIFYDRLINKFRLEWYDNYENHITGEGNFTDDDTLVMIEKYARKGRSIIERHIEKFTGDSSRIHLVETFINGEFSKTSEIKFEKIGS